MSDSEIFNSNLALMGASGLQDATMQIAALTITGQKITGILRADSGSNVTVSFHSTDPALNLATATRLLKQRYSLLF